MDSASTLPTAPRALRFEWRVTRLQLLIALTSFALALRLIGIDLRPLWLDEASSAWFSGQTFHYLWSVLPTYETHPPLYYSVLKLWCGILGSGHVEMRVFSVLLGTLTIPVIIATVFELERQQPTGRPLLRAGVAGWLAACSPILMVLDQEARPYPLLVLAYAVATLALLRLTREFKAGAAGAWSSWLLLGASTELTLWSHGLGALYAGCLAIALVPAWLRKPLERARLVRGVTTAVLVAVLYLPCLLMIAGRAHDWGTTWLKWQAGDLIFKLVGLYTVSGEALTVGSAVAALVMVLLIKRALVSTYRAQGWAADRALLLLWLGPTLVSVLISVLFAPVFMSRTLAPTLVPAYLAIAGALARTDGPRERRVLAAAMCIALVPAAVLMALRPESERWDLLASYLERHVAPGDAVWLYPNDSALPLAELGQPIPGEVRGIPAAYPALGVSGPIRAGSPAVVSVTPQQATALASDPALRRVPVIWLVTRQSDIFDPQRDMPKALARVRRAGAARDWGYIEVRPYYAR